MMNDPHQILTIEIVDNRLVISIGISALTFSILQGDWAQQYDENAAEFLTPIVTNETAFAAAIAHELENEDEDGDSVLHRCFDKAAQSAVENGCDGIKMPGDTR